MLLDFMTIKMLKLSKKKGSSIPLKYEIIEDNDLDVEIVDPLVTVGETQKYVKIWYVCVCVCTRTRACVSVYNKL